MHGIHTHIRETNHVPRGYIVAAVLSLLFVVPLFLVPALALLFFYVSTFRSMRAVLNMAIIIIIIIIIITCEGISSSDNGRSSSSSSNGGVNGNCSLSTVIAMRKHWRFKLLTARRVYWAKGGGGRSPRAPRFPWHLAKTACSDWNKPV